MPGRHSWLDFGRLQGLDRVCVWPSETMQTQCESAHWETWMEEVCYNKEAEVCRATVSCNIVVVRVTFDVHRFLTSLGGWSFEGGGTCLNPMDVGNWNIPRGCLGCPRSCPKAQQHGQLSDWPWQPDRAQTGLSWMSTDACLVGQRPRAVLSQTWLSTAAHWDGTEDSASPRRAPPNPQHTCTCRLESRCIQSGINPHMSTQCSHVSELSYVFLPLNLTLILPLTLSLTLTKQCHLKIKLN